jgi:hypothetical protein
MAGNPKNRVRFTTDGELLKLASAVPLYPPVDKAVFHAEDEGAKLAAEFVAKNPDYVRLDELLQRTRIGLKLWAEIKKEQRPWTDTEEIWWELSWRLARSAKGVVNVFGPKRIVEERPLSEFRHKYSTGSYANTVFEKVELPELEANPNVSKIFYNGKPLT